MTPQQLEAFVDTLADMKTRTLARMQGGARDLAGEDGPPPDLTDRASLEADRNFALLMRERDRKLLTDIAQALTRIEAGEYGVCEECGEDIALARLKARPMATLCVNCQTAREEEESLRAAGAVGFFLA